MNQRVSSSPLLTSSMASSAAKPSVLIVGAGCFGISSAYHFLQRGYTDVTILDRAAVLPASDAASTDINKICRSTSSHCPPQSKLSICSLGDYSDPIYAKLAMDAIVEFRKPEYRGLYHETGLLCTAPANYVAQRAAFKNVSDLGVRNQIVSSASDLRRIYPEGEIMPQLKPDDFSYVNHEGGWVESGEVVKLMTQRCIASGAKVIPGQSVKDFVEVDGKMIGLVTEGGQMFKADLIVLAAGAWTEGLLRKTALETPDEFLTASGQMIVAFQLDEETSKKYSRVPVILQSNTGYYMFPPTASGEVKCVFHAPGYLHIPPESEVSVPKTSGAHAVERAPIPKRDVQQIRKALREYYPDLADKQIAWTRVCFYTDSCNSEFLIAKHPKHTNVSYASAGSGHAFKMMPILGRYVADLIEGNLDASLARKWGFDGRKADLGGNRAGVAKRDNLLTAEMADESDLKGIHA